ncbi:hypothetical protein KCU78_g15806, partial [Aureobasidium melanogenum]
MTKLGVTLLALGLVSLARGQSVGADGITTVITANCTTTGTQTYAFVDAASSTYQYMCGGGSGGSTLTVIPSASIAGWQGCFTYCDITSGCAGFSYNQGAVYGAGPGQCILKSGSINFASTTNLISTRIAGLNTRYIAKPSPTFSCPQQDTQTVTDTYGGVYQISCGNDTTGTSPSDMQAAAPNNFDDCFALCDNYTPVSTQTVYTSCNAFVYIGASSNGVGAGHCYLKYASPSATFSSVSYSNYVGAVRIAAVATTATASTVFTSTLTPAPGSLS